MQWVQDCRVRQDAPSNKCHVRNDSLKIFISSRQEELKRERDLAYEAVEQTGHDLSKPLKPFLDENETATPSTTIITHCSENIKGSKAIICIYYKTVSEIVKNEFRWANERGIPIFIFKKEPQGRDEADEDLTTFIEKEVRPPSTKSPGPYGIYVFKRFTGDNIKANIIKSLKEYYPTWFNFKPIPEKYIPSVTEPDRLDRTRHVYVKPRCYSKAEEILRNNRILIIAGPPHIGKTSMGFHLADSFKKTLSRRFIIFPETGDLSDIVSLNNTVILLDDPFGAVTFNNPFVGDKFDSFQHIANRNYIIIASRSEVLNDAYKATRLGENNLERFILELKQADYVEENFEAILEKHLNFFNVSLATKEFANNHKKEILNDLRFPHNYEVFVREELNQVMNRRKGFNHALKDAKRIERAVRNWFSGQYEKDKEIFYFLLILTLCGKLEEEDFFRIYKKSIEILNNVKRINLPLPTCVSRLRNDTSSYVSKSGPIKFEHPSYRQGIIDSIKDSWLSEVLIVSKQMAVDADRRLRSRAALFFRELTTAIPSESLFVLETLTRDESAVVRQHSVLVLGNAGLSFPDVIMPILDTTADDVDPFVRQHTAWALRTVANKKPHEAICILKRLLWDKIYFVRKHAMLAIIEISRLYPAEVIPLLIELLMDEDANMRLRATWALGETAKVRPTETIPLLEELVRNEDGNICAYAAQALGMASKEHPTQVIPILENVAKVKNYNVSYRAIRALGGAGKSHPKEVLPILEMLSKSEDHNIRHFVIRALKKLGKKHPTNVIPLLEAMVANNVHPRVLYYATKTLNRLTKAQKKLLLRKHEL